jgi:hypothetical protein
MRLGEETFGRDLQIVRFGVPRASLDILEQKLNEGYSSCTVKDLQPG